MLSFYIHQQQLKANHEERYNEGQSKNTETFVITFLLYIILPNDLAIIFKQFEKKNWMFSLCLRIILTLKLQKWGHGTGTLSYDSITFNYLYFITIKIVPCYYIVSKSFFLVVTNENISRHLTALFVVLTAKSSLYKLFRVPRGIYFV